MTSAAGGGNDGNVDGGIGVSSSSHQADSLVSLLSGLSDSASNQLLSSQRHSLATLKQQQRDGNRGSLIGQRSMGIRRSARLPAHHQKDYLRHNDDGFSSAQLVLNEGGGNAIVKMIQIDL